MSELKIFNPSNYELWLLRDDGKRMLLFDETYFFNYSRAANHVGWGTIALPESFNDKLIGTDYMLDVWRRPPFGNLRREDTYMLRRYETYTRQDGVSVKLFGGFSGNDLLRRRIVAYKKGTSETSKSDLADDMMKEIVRENLGASATNADRIMPASQFSVAPDSSAGPTLEHEFAYRNVFEVLIELAQASRDEGAEIFYEIVPTANGVFEFRTYLDQLGVDRTSGPKAMIFGLADGTLESPRLVIDSTDEVNFAYVGGPGNEEDRFFIARGDDDAINRSLWNRREAFGDSRNEKKVDAWTDTGMTMLQEGRVRQAFDARFLDTEGARYAIDWDYGDKVLVNYAGRQFPVILRAVFVSVNNNSNETITARAEIGESVEF